MVVKLSNCRRKITPASFRSRKCGGAPITLVTAYDYPFASYAEQAGIDIVFVSDAFASVGMGCDNTLSVTVDEVVYHTRAVRRAVSSSLVLASLPFLSYTTPADAVQNAGRLIRDGGADAVEIEGNADLVPVVRALTKAGIAVVAHVGLTKVLAARTGSYRSQAQDAESAIAIIHDALALSDAGAFALVVECIPDRIAAAITELVPIPTIGIGAGGYCDGQGLVTQDMLGLFEKFTPKFVQKFAALGETARDGFRLFKENVESAAFPGSAHTLAIGDEKLGDIVARLNGATNGTPY
jgi:3-methyl-2-oxobutanoate hydroxymethyltransferase